MKLTLPKKENIYNTGYTDPINFHYQPVVRFFVNKRLKMALSLLKNKKLENMLDIGCGGGVFLPELSKRCNRLYATDIHNNLSQVSAMARLEGIRVMLAQNNLYDISFGDAVFDCVICLSVLEFVGDLKKAFSEIYRITKPGGIVVIGFPAINIFTTLGYFSVGLTEGDKLHLSTQRDIISAAEKRFKTEKIVKFPFFPPLDYSLFICGLFRK